MTSTAKGRRRARPKRAARSKRVSEAAPAVVAPSNRETQTYPAYVVDGFARRWRDTAIALRDLLEIHDRIMRNDGGSWNHEDGLKLENARSVAGLEKIYPCHSKPRKEWCDHYGRGGFMGHTCQLKDGLYW